MPNARSRRRGQAPQPRSGAPKAQGLTAATCSAAQSGVPSLAIRHTKSPSSTKAAAPKAASTRPKIYTSLTDVTRAEPRRLGSIQPTLTGLTLPIRSWLRIPLIVNGQSVFTIRRNAHIGYD